ncbi:BTB/POZ domain-containing protein KCTD9 [Trichogramma pretiosum]|uniref:KHA domain-containing protein n=1 Tax=Trichogramma kaykai TaxID=54128 RepID=A0ABD2WC71_9HYME|nr:BTB/POZ domain-containing protein KCTD9 [Trichogramma pretiosum]
MKRVILFLNGTDVNGKVFLVTHCIDELFKEASMKFNIKAKRLFTPQGGEIDDINLIRDDDILYVSSGEDFAWTSKEYSLGNKNTDWVTLNVGGKYFSTTRSTLINKEPMSMLARMFTETGHKDCQLLPGRRDKNGAYLIDRSPTYFEPILNYLRHGQLIMDSTLNPLGVLEEARFFGIEGIVSNIEQMIQEEEEEKKQGPLTRKDILKAIMSTPTSTELRFQGVSLIGADLSKLDLRNINFKFADLRHCNLSSANLTGCCLERADLSGANLAGAQLVCVKMSCANLEDADLHSCNFEDPGGKPALMEGVNLKGANLEGSNMAAANLRVATLKHAVLRNCDLRSAVLAGADLESCDLSGSDLHEANLRGANLKDAAFELMLTPLHMSQTIR